MLLSGSVFMQIPLSQDNQSVERPANNFQANYQQQNRPLSCNINTN